MANGNVKNVKIKQTKNLKRHLNGYEKNRKYYIIQIK